MKNNVEQVLKYGSIALFVLSIIGAALASQKTEMILNPDFESYLASSSEYITTSSFNGTIFFTTVISSAIMCTLMYAFGELISLVAENNRLLGTARNNDRSTKPSEEPIKTYTTDSLSPKKPEELSPTILPYDIPTLSAKLSSLEKEKKLKAIGFELAGMNHSIHTFYFHAYPQQDPFKQTIELKLTKVSEFETSLLLKPASKASIEKMEALCALLSVA